MVFGASVYGFLGMRCSYNLRIALAPQRQRGSQGLHWHRSASVVWRICTGTAAPAWFGGFALAPQRQRGLEGYNLRILRDTT